MTQRWSYGEPVLADETIRWSEGGLYLFYEPAAGGATYEAAMGLAVGAYLSQSPALILNPAMGLQAGAGLSVRAQADLLAVLPLTLRSALALSGQQVMVASVDLEVAAAWGLEAAADMLAATILGGRADFTFTLPALRLVWRGNRLLVVLFPDSVDLKLS